MPVPDRVAKLALCGLFREAAQKGHVAISNKCKIALNPSKATKEDTPLWSPVPGR